MNRTMYDGIVTGNLPAGAALYAGYEDGAWPDAAALAQRFPSAIIVRVTVSASDNEGQVLDVENGDATPAQAVGWIQRRRSAGIDPSVYCNSSTWPAVRAAFAAAGVAEPHYWIAQYDGDPTIPDGAIAKQYASNTGYDTSSVAAYWPGIDPTSNPTQNQETDMILHAITGNPEIWALSGGLYWHVDDPQSMASYEKAGVPMAVITGAEHAAILAAAAPVPVTVTIDAAQLAAALAPLLAAPTAAQNATATAALLATDLAAKG